MQQHRVLQGDSPAASPIRLRVLSLGAGVQSTTLALLAAHGVIGPMPDCANFADTAGRSAEQKWTSRQTPIAANSNAKACAAYSGAGLPSLATTVACHGAAAHGPPAWSGPRFCRLSSGSAPICRKRRMVSDFDRASVDLSRWCVSLIFGLRMFTIVC